MDEKLLGIYLNDHLAGSTIGLRLVRRLWSSNRSTEFEPLLARLASEIEDDRDSLFAVVDRLDVRRDPVKRVFAVVGELGGRLKLNGRIRGYSPLSRLIELEGLSLGVAGKLKVWRTLALAATEDPRLREFDFESLVARAERQLDELEDARLRAANWL